MNAQTIADGIYQRYLARTATSRRRDEEAQQVLPGGDTRIATYYAPYPTYMVRGSGCTLYDADGGQYIDFLNNYTSLIHGHAHPAIVEVAADQVMRGTVFGAAAEPQIQLARMLTERVPSIDLVRFANSGTEATMMAMRTARAFTGKNVIVKIDGGYHGSHDFAEVSVYPDTTSNRLPEPHVEGRGVPRSVLNEIMVAPFNDLSGLELILSQHAAVIAAVILEPMPNAGGMVPPQPGYLAGVRRLCDQYGVLLIFDEIVTFRLHSAGMQAIAGVQPDLTALGKIIGGGFPVGAFGGKREIMSQYDPRHPQFIMHTGTFNGNNMTMSAGIAALEHLPQSAIDRVNALGDRLRDGITAAFHTAGIAGQALGFGSLMQVHWTNQPIPAPREAALAARSAGRLQELLHLELLNRGVHIGPRGIICTSTAMTDADITFALDQFAAALATLRPYVAEMAPHLLLNPAP
ncbi:MAG: aspartate aminotransferase family protein [Anaerolineae bacterium]|nr:aspartate aminotransferase family protein [Anaerolineae bacterium]